MNLRKPLLAVCVFGLAAGAAFAQDYESIEGAVVYDYDPATKLGDDVFGTVVSNLERDFPGRNSHGGPVCMQYPDGRIVTFNTNTSDHNLDGWSEHAESRDWGKSWKMYNRFPYSFEAYSRDAKRPAWIEAGLVTSKGTVVVFVTHFLLGGTRTMSGFMRSYDQGATWTAYESVDGVHIGYPVGTAVDGDTNYVIYDSDGGSDGRRPHVLYVSTDDGRSWQKRSTLPLQDDVWYGAITLMPDGGLLAGAYHSKDEYHFYYCISKDQGRTWTEERKAKVDQKVRDPELGQIGGRYYLHGRSGSYGEGSDRFVLYESSDGENWGSAIVVSKQTGRGDGYSANCLLDTDDDGAPDELMVVFSIQYKGVDTNEHVFFIRPDN